MDRKPTYENDFAIEEIIVKTVSKLENQAAILYPTDTIWGLGCDATNEAAIRKIFTIKNRPEDKPFIMLVSDLEMLEHYVGSVHPKIDRLLNFHSRPLTVVYPKAQNLPPLAHAANGSVAVRIANDEFCKKLIATFGKPLISTSANISDAPFPKHFGEISSAVISKVDFVVPFRQDDNSIAEPSVMVTLSEKDELIFLRS